MANIFGVLTALVLLISAYVAFQNKEAYEKELADAEREAGNLVTSQQLFTEAKATAEALKPYYQELIAEFFPDKIRW